MVQIYTVHALHYFSVFSPLCDIASSLRYVASNDLTTPQKRFGDMSKMNNRQLNSVISICSSTLKMKYIPSWAQKICSSNSSSHDLNSRDCIPCLMFSNVEHPSPPPSILAQFEAKNVQNNNIVFFLKIFVKKVFSFAFL